MHTTAKSKENSAHLHLYLRFQNIWGTIIDPKYSSANMVASNLLYVYFFITAQDIENVVRILVFTQVTKVSIFDPYLYEILQIILEF